MKPVEIKIPQKRTKTEAIYSELAVVGRQPPALSFGIEWSTRGGRKLHGEGKRRWKASGVVHQSSGHEEVGGGLTRGERHLM